MLEILKYPDERLRQHSLPVERFNEELHTFLDEMAVTMYSANGIGLAAPQVARFIRCFVIDIGEGHEEPKRRDLREFINPKLSNGEGKIVFEEGCLSIPGFSEEVQRNRMIRVDYQDRNGNSKSLVVEGLLAVAIQHENDHLEGVLFVDRLSPLKRTLAKRKLSKDVVTL